MPDEVAQAIFTGVVLGLIGLVWALLRNEISLLHNTVRDLKEEQGKAIAELTDRTEIIMERHHKLSEDWSREHATLIGRVIGLETKLIEIQTRQREEVQRLGRLEQISTIIREEQRQGGQRRFKKPDQGEDD
jgi:hypothetical protein